MSERITRRELAKRGLLGAAALALPPIAAAQEASPTVSGPSAEAKIAKVEGQLAKPLGDKAKGLLKGAIDGIESASSGRQKHKLPENSEPCFVYAATPIKGSRS